MSWQYTKELRDADRKLADEREKHWKELREADLIFAKLLKEMNEIHFSGLNEHSKKTTEERGHFLATEVYEPFRESVTKQLAVSAGSQRGSNQVIYFAIAAIGIFFGFITMMISVIAAIAAVVIFVIK